MTGISRNVEARIGQLLRLFPVVLLVGARQVGKTTLARQGRGDWRYFDLENAADHDFITRDIDFFFREHPRRVIIDEAQEAPELLRHLRGVVDARRREAGRFLLTGSSSPELLTGISDTLAGRMAVLEIAPLKMNELREQPLPAFYQLFEQELDADAAAQLLTLEPQIDDVLPHLLIGGYPEPTLRWWRSEQDEVQRQHDFALWMENYQLSYLQQDIRRLFPRLDLRRYRRFVSMLGVLSGTIVNRAQLGRSLDVSEVTVRDYLEVAHDTFYWRMLPSFESGKEKSLIKMPKGLVRDAGINHYLAGIDSRDKLLRSPLVGQNFEAFVIEEILRGIQATRATGWDYHYFRTRNGAEIDLILSGKFGLLPVEIKFGERLRLQSLTALRQFIERHDLPFGIVVNNSTRVQRVTERIIQLPVGCL